MDLAAVQVAVEQACQQFKDPATQHAAEQVLLQFQQSHRPLAACQHILERSASLDARFQAACTLRVSIVREWASMSPEERTAVRTYILHWVLRDAGDASQGVVRSTLVGALAALLKRGWPEMAQEDRFAFFQELQTSVHNAGGGPAQRVYFDVLEAVVGEFSLATASPMGLPWEVHERCRNELEAQFLHAFFESAVGFAQAAVQSGAALHGDDAGSTAAAVSLMVAVLAWDFRSTAAHDAAALAGRRGLSDSMQVCPGPAWTKLLLSPSTTEWLLQLLPSLRGPAATGPLAIHARHAIVALSSLAGDVFPRPQQQQSHNGSSAPAVPETLHHIQQLLRAMLPWVHPAHAALHQALACDEGEVVDACRALSALCSNLKPAVLAAAAGGLAASNAPHLFAVMEALTTGLLEGGGGSAHAAAEPWQHECCEMLMEAWSGLLAPQCSAGAGVLAPVAGAAQAAERVFSALVDASLKEAAEGAHEDVDEEEAHGAGASSQDESMARAAVLARAAAPVTLARLTEVLGSLHGALARAAASGADPSAVLEQLCWLLRMVAHCLADSGSGETPLPPEGVLLAVESPAGAEAVEHLSRALLEVAALCLNEAARPMCSPRLMEAAVWAAARWADTYLFPEEPLPAALEAAFGGAGSGPGVLEGLVRVATTCLVSYPGERELHTEVCRELLPVLVRRPAVCRRLLQLQSWQQLAHAFASRDARLTSQLAQKLHRSLAKSLCAAAAGYDDAGPAAQYVEHLLGAIVNAVQGMAEQPTAALASRMQRADAQLEVSCMLESLRGAALATLPQSQPALFALFCRLLQPLLALHEACKQQPHVVALLLKLADAIIESQVADYLEGQQMTVLFRWSLALLTHYSKSNLWQVSLQTARSLQDERQSEQCRDLRALLKLLTHITQNSVMDAASSSRDGMAGPGPGSAAMAAAGPSGQCANGEQQPDIAQVVLLGLNVVVPLINNELLKFPKLSRLYYGLLAHMLEAYPQHIVALAPQHFSTLMGTLEMGLLGTDTAAAQACLEGLAGLARWHCRQQHMHQQLQAASNGGAGQAAYGLHAHTAGGKSVVAHFQELLLRRLLLEDAPTEFVAVASDALLPLLLADPNSYQHFGNALLASHAPDPQAAAAMSRSLSELVAGAGGASGVQGDAAMSRDAQRQFRQRLAQVVADMRGLIRVR